ncbi:MAG: phosphodiesterase [Clostridiales bacterium]|nr:phosphodiesterase [Clostridiales bacterium]
MKLMFASDIHGSKTYCEKLLEIYKKEGASKLVLLGDLLYHGARNDLTLEYDTKAVAELLNSVKDEILCVRGNCDSEVDQMVLEFPIMAEYAAMLIEDRMLFITHGHVFNPSNLPPLKKGDILINGHTHVKAIESIGEYTYLNPGSISLPKDGVNSYMILEDGVFYLKDIKMNILTEPNTGRYALK